MTVVGLTLKTRAVSRIPLPLRAMSTICCFTAGGGLGSGSVREKCAAGRRCCYSGSAVGHGAACHTAPHRHPDSLDNGPVQRSWRPPRWTMTEGPFYQHVNSFGTPPATYGRQRTCLIVRSGRTVRERLRAADAGRPVQLRLSSDCARSGQSAGFGRLPLHGDRADRR